MQLEDLPTPCLVLDRGILERNLRRMSSAMHRLGVSLRPHMKTAKSADVARMAVAGEAGGITVSTLAEAEYFAERGFQDITIAAGTTPAKLDRIQGFISNDLILNVITDDVAVARAIASHAAPVRALIEIDSGENRGGVDPEGDAVIEIGRALGEKLSGVLTHAGHSYECRTVEQVREVAEQERVAVTTAAERLRSSGMACETVSVGSTPTMSHVDRLDGVTEVRPGVYMFCDLFQAAIRSCTRDDIALTVLASVIGCRPDANQIVLDAGALALSKDRSTASTPEDAGFGLVWDLDGKPGFGECVIHEAYQEHGVARGLDGGLKLPFDELKVGTKVRVAMNHSCLTAAAHDRYYVVDGSREVIDEWGRVNGW
ncbi:MAG TPA: alanine racemase [Gemmatimonadaceae bacterium]|nr:alanine racemase [Gemmatimonadaceae bacterium]